MPDSPVVVHLGTCLGAPAQVWREAASDRMPIDVHVIEGDPITLFTSGMSARPMKGDRYAELIVRVAAGSKPAAEDWPARWLRSLARMPHEYATWLAPGHTIPNGDPAQPLAPDVPFIGFAIGPPTSLTEAQCSVVTPDHTIALYAIYPLHPDEMAYKLAHGADALFELLDRAGITDEIDLARPSVAPR